MRLREYSTAGGRPWSVSCVTVCYVDMCGRWFWDKLSWRPKPLPRLDFRRSGGTSQARGRPRHCARPLSHLRAAEGKRAGEAVTRHASAPRSHHDTALRRIRINDALKRPGMVGEGSVFRIWEVSKFSVAAWLVAGSVGYVLCALRGALERAAPPSLGRRSSPPVVPRVLTLSRDRVATCAQTSDRSSIRRSSTSARAPSLPRRWTSGTRRRGSDSTAAPTEVRSVSSFTCTVE